MSCLRPDIELLFRAAAVLEYVQETQAGPGTLNKVGTVSVVSYKLQSLTEKWR